jgi:protein phosphatase
MGGHQAGEIASSRAIEIITCHLSKAAINLSQPLIGAACSDVSIATNQLASAVRLANHTVHQEAARDAACNGMGTTVVAAWLVGPIWSIAHVGDSRLYLIRNRMLQALTADHSLVRAQVLSGVLEAEEAEHVPHRHVLTRAVGVHATVEVELAELPVLDGDIMLLCSDGLTTGVPADAILRAVHESSDPQTVSDRLVALSNAAGGTDNTTVIVISLRQNKPGVWSRIRGRLFTALSIDLY